MDSNDTTDQYAQQPTSWYFDADAQSISLRDWFAGHSLSGVLADPECITRNENDRERVARFCYQMADAMMKARGEI